MIEAGIREKPMATTKTTKEPLVVEALSFYLYVIGKGAVITLNLKSGLLVASFRIASYIS